MMLGETLVYANIAEMATPHALVGTQGQVNRGGALGQYPLKQMLIIVASAYDHRPLLGPPYICAFPPCFTGGHCGAKRVIQ